MGPGGLDRAKQVAARGRNGPPILSESVAAATTIAPLPELEPGPFDDGLSRRVERRLPVLALRHQLIDLRGLGATDENRRHDQITQRHKWRLADADRLTVHESEEGEHRAGQREARGLAKCAVDDKRRNRAEHQASKNSAAAHDREPLIEHAHLRELVDAYHRDAGTGRA